MANQHKIWTILDVIDWGRDFFTKKRIESPRLNIELLLCHALSLSRLALYSRFDQPLNNSELESIREMVLRRAKTGQHAGLATGDNLLRKPVHALLACWGKLI